MFGGVYVIYDDGRPLVEAYDGPQVVGMELHRRRSVLVRMTEDGRKLGTARITNSPPRLAAEIGRAGKHPQSGAGGHVRLVLGGGHAGGGWRRGAPGAPAGGQGVQPTGGSRTTSWTPATWPTCCGWAAGGGVDRPAGDPRAAGDHPVPAPMPTSA